MRSTRLGVGLLVGAVVASLAGCAPPGDLLAGQLAERVIIGIGDDITPPYPTPREADFLAAWALDDPRLPPAPAADYVVEALAWQGNSGDEAGARIELRVTVDLRAGGSTFGNPWVPEGGAVRCWQLTVFGLHDYDSLRQQEIGCPTTPAPPPPTPAPIPDLPDDVDALLAQAITGATAADIDERVREAFPEDYYSIESQSHEGELAVALGIPAESECVVGVVHADGSVEVLRGWKRELLQPGEMGCSPRLYFSPVVTH